MRDKSDMSGASVETVDKVEECEGTERGRGPWMRDTVGKLGEAIGIGVRSSGKRSTRGYRVRFYTERLSQAKIEVAFYEELLRLEEEQESLSRRYDREMEVLEDELRKLELREQLMELRERVGKSGYERDDESDTEGTVRTDEVEGSGEWDTTVVKVLR